MSVTMHHAENVGYLIIDTPPFGTPDVALPQRLLDAVQWAEAARLTRVVLSGNAPHAWEFGHVAPGPTWLDVCNAIDASHVPWIAAITGNGFGAELAMACRMRIIAPDAQIGLPDVTLGIIPGAGGTQRLPRLVGVQAALEMICFGQPVAAQAALSLGLVHAVEDDPIAEAYMVNTEELGCIVPTWELPAPHPDRDVIAAARQAVAERSPQHIAPRRALDVIEAGLPKDFQDALRVERRAFLELQGSDQAKALSHIFAAERAANGLEDRQAGAEVRNRILARYFEAADTVFMDGSTPWEVDEAMVDFGYVAGPYEAQDVLGLDIVHADLRRPDASRDPDRRIIPIADRMLELGKLGRKTGAGWYRYPGGGGKVDDPIVADLALEEAHFAGRARTDYGAAEITRRLTLAMINEAADLLHEGAAKTSRDIDLLSVEDLGFPRWRGGLMYFADNLGVPAIVRDLEELAKEDPVAWKASPALLACRKTGLPLTAYKPHETA